MKKPAIKHIILLILIISKLSAFAQTEPTDSVLDIETCRELMLTHDYQIKIAKEQLHIAENSRKSSFTNFFPSIDFTGQYMLTNKKWYLLDENVFLPVVPFWAIDENTMDLNPEIMENPLISGIMIDPETGGLLTDNDGNPVFLQYAYAPSDQFQFGSKNLFMLNTGMTQPIYLGGKIRSQYRIAKLSESIQKDRIELTEDERIVGLENLYWKIVSLQEKRILAKRYKTMLDTLVKDVENMYDEGIVTRNEVLQAKLKQNEVEFQVFQVENGLSLANTALNQMIGFPLDTTVTLSDEILPVHVYTDRNEMISSALQNRPELNLLNKSNQLADEGVKLAWSRFLPNIVATANYGWYNPNPYNGFQNEFGGDWNVGITCRIPITQWGKRVHGLNSAKALKEIASLKTEETRELIQLEVQQTWNQYLEAFKHVETRKIGLEQAKENLKIQTDYFHEGMIKLADLLEAQALWQESHAQLLEAQAELREQEIKIKKSTGQL